MFREMSSKAAPTENPTMVQAANLLTFLGREDQGLEYTGRGLCAGVIHNYAAKHHRTKWAFIVALEAQWSGIVIRRAG